jgi:hypothetical protein
MKFAELLQYVSDADLDFLSAETKVNHQVKKLKGSIVFKLILYSMLESNKPSLRVMEAYFNSATFKTLAKIKESSVKYNSISDRITGINPEYFEKIFELLFEKFNKILKEEKSVQKYDSTMVAISSRLVDWGMRVGYKTKKVQLKYTIGMQGSLPCSFKIYRKQEQLAEDKTIPNVILDYKYKSSGVVVFDRGVKDRTILTGFSNQNVLFVTRINPNVNFEIIKKRKVKKNPKASGVVVSEDLTIYLIKRVVKKAIKTPLRLIKAKIKEKNEDIFFVTNNFELEAHEIANIYKQRWEIEVFFKFLKQELNLNHITNRSLNGIKVMLYMTLILSILLITYKKMNNIKGYKIMKIQVSNELQNYLIREIVVLSGGNPDLVSQYLSDA